MASDNIQSQVISILPLNQTSFTSGKKIVIDLNPDLGFIKASRGESYLLLTVKNAGSMRAMFSTSCQALINRVDVFNLVSGMQLESLQNYNQVQYLLDQYTKLDHSLQKSIEGMKKDLYAYKTEGGILKKRLVSSSGASEDVYNSVLSPIDINGNPIFQGANYVVPLHLGIFSSYDDERLTPIMKMGGIRLEITLETEKLSLVPICPLVSGKEYKIISDTTKLAITQGVDNFKISIANKLVSDVDFMVGDNVFVVSTTGAPAQGLTSATITQITQTGANVVITLKDEFDLNAGAGFLLRGLPVENTADDFKLKILNTNVEATGLCVGQALVLNATGGNVDIKNRTIVSMAQNVNDVDIIYSGGGPIPTINFGDGTNTSGCLAVSKSQYSAGLKYEIQNVEFRATQIFPTSQMIASATPLKFNYKFRTFDTFYDSIPSQSKRFEVEIPSVSSMAKCVMCLVLGADDEDNLFSQDYYTGKCPDEMGLNSIQWFINNKLYPLRDYNPKSKEDRPQQLNELQKSFSAGCMPCLSFGDASGENLNNYSCSFLVSRELARGRYVYSLREAQPSIRLQFDGSRTQILRTNTFVWCDKIISISEKGTSILV